MHQGVIVVRFTNNSTLYAILNSPLFYVRRPSMLRNMMTLVGADLSKMTHVIWHQFNSLFWASFSFNDDCPGMGKHANRSTSYHMTRDYGQRTIPTATEVIDHLKSGHFQGALLLSKRAFKIQQVCGTNTSMGFRLHCWDHMERFKLDKDTA